MAADDRMSFSCALLVSRTGGTWCMPIQLYIDLVVLWAHVLPMIGWPFRGESRQTIVGGGKL